MERRENSRDIGFIKGAKFYREDGETIFTFGIDPGNVIGPRKATDADKRNHAGEWEAFKLANLDHDHNGRRGGAVEAIAAQHAIDEQAAQAQADAAARFQASLAPPIPVKNRGGRPRKAQQ